MSLIGTILWVVFMLLLITLVVLSIVWLARHLTVRPQSSDDPDQILRRQYAGGRIDRDEYLQRRADLGLDSS